MIARRMRLKEIAVMTTAALRLFLPRLERAMDKVRKSPPSFSLIRLFFFFFILFMPLPYTSVYFTASIGETLPATLPGFRLLKYTVRMENPAPNTKIHGLNFREISIPE